MASRPLDLPTIHSKLSDYYAVHPTRRGVAQALGVDEKTIARWLKALTDKGFKDPRPKRAPRKAAKKPAAKRARKKDLAQ